MAAFDRLFQRQPFRSYGIECLCATLSRSLRTAASGPSIDSIMKTKEYTAVGFHRLESQVESLFDAGAADAVGLEGGFGALEVAEGDLVVVEGAGEGGAGIVAIAEAGGDIETGGGAGAVVVR